MALYKDGNPVSGLNSIPRLTLAQYNSLATKPEFWIRTDAPESYKKLSADQVSYDSNNTVKQKIDSVENQINFRILSNSYWAWASQTSYSTEVSRNNSVIVYGGRSGVGFMAICPNNNNEVFVITNNTGCTISHTFDGNTGKHTITLSNATTRVGSSILVTVVG